MSQQQQQKIRRKTFILSLHVAFRALTHFHFPAQANQPNQLNFTLQHVKSTLYAKYEAKAIS